jgi:lipid-A-disaccharide synthase
VNEPPTVLSVAGEASGDGFAAGVARALGAPCFGMGGAASLSAGVDVVARMEAVTAMGGVEVLGRAAALLRAHVHLVRAVRRRTPRAAVLVGYTEYAAWLGRWLRARGVRVLRAMAPQVWAWRPSRLRSIGRSLDRLAVVLPFEEAIFRAAKVDATYVGHPAIDARSLRRQDARAELGIAADASAVALLPGSRPHEVRALAPAMLDAVAKVGVFAGLFASPALDARTRAWLSRIAAERSVPVFAADPVQGAMPYLRAFDASVAASGTATLECALSDAPPVVVYRMAKPSWALARMLVRVRHTALPNILLGASVYPELLQGRANARAIASALETVLAGRAAFEQPARALRAALSYRGDLEGCSSAERAAGLVRPWLEGQDA